MYWIAKEKNGSYCVVSPAFNNIPVKNLAMATLTADITPQTLSRRRKTVSAGLDKKSSIFMNRILDH